MGVDVHKCTLVTCDLCGHGVAEKGGVEFVREGVSAAAVEQRERVDVPPEPLTPDPVGAGRPAQARPDTPVDQMIAKCTACTHVCTVLVW